MKYNNCRSKYCVSLVLTLLLILVSHAQELPPIINYTSDVYAGANQNWSISQGENKFIYVANNDGLLEFNGASWQLYPSPNKTIMRSVHATNGRIYTGSYMDFGFWTPNELGALIYESLSIKLNLELVEDEQIWNIVPHNEWVLFQSLNRIYIYNSEANSIRFIEASGTINKLFEVDDELFFQVLNEGLYTIENGGKSLVSESPSFKEDVVIDIFKLDEAVVFVTNKNGFFFLEDGITQKWNIPADGVLKGLSVYNSRQLKNGSIVIGTIANGILLISKEGELVLHINQYNGLSDNTALSLFEDVEGNIWVGLDNGIDCINFPSPFSNYVDQRGRLGTTYASILHNGSLYLGTNQGLFYKPITAVSDFIFVSGTEGQVWSLNTIGGQLFCGHNSGTFLIEQGEARLIASETGTWDIKEIEGHPETLLQGNYSGLHILKRADGVWRLSHKLTGFNISSKHFELTDNGKILVSHEYKGLYTLDVASDLSKVHSYTRDPAFNDGANSSLAAYDGNVYYACIDGIFRYNVEQDKFENNEELSTIFSEDEYISGKLIADDKNRLWVFTENYINYVSKEKVSAVYTVHKIPIPRFLRNEKQGYENISRITGDTYLLGTSDGYLLADISEIEQRDYKVVLTGVYNGTKKGSALLVSSIGNSEFKSGQNYFEFEYSIPEYEKYLVAEYQYSLFGPTSREWSEWSTNPSISFENLRYGDYQFNIKAKINNREVDNTAIYEFTINRPWYLSNVAIGLYVLGVISFFIFVNAFYKRYYRRQRERLLDNKTREMELKELAVQKELIQLKNESLKQDIEARNRELAISTMSMIKKNNALSSIKEELIQLKEIKTVKPVISLINKTMNDSNDWKFFEEAFNHADKDFFKKVKELHPELTTNDLRLCVYLRLNLSSKEIAPLLNISPRSVEIKRYRLRKKIHLGREVNLNDYFINL